MTIETGLLGLIAALLLWAQVWPGIRSLTMHQIRRRRKVVAVAAAHAPAAPSTTMQLHLCDSTGRVEHEISYTGADAPENYTYGVKTYRQEARVHTSDPRDYIWEYRR